MSKGKLLITGGTGSFGNAYLKQALSKQSFSEIIIFSRDELKQNDLRQTINSDKVKFYLGDIRDYEAVNNVVQKVDFIFHAAALKQVPSCEFFPIEAVKTNVIGTSVLLDAFHEHWKSIKDSVNEDFIFLHVSTDEVFGELDITDDPFKESNKYLPNSPYSASKASSDHLARAYFKTYGLPVIISNCSNNYGPYQFPEKLIPLTIRNALKGKNIPIYGNGHQIRDWLHVSDHCSALRLIMSNGQIGETYNIGGNAEKRNIDVVNYICEILDQLKPRKDLKTSDKN